MAHLDADFHENMAQIIEVRETLQMICSDTIRRIEAAEFDLASAADEGEKPATVEGHRGDIAAARALVDTVTKLIGSYSVQGELEDVVDVVDEVEPAF